MKRQDGTNSMLHKKNNLKVNGVPNMGLFFYENLPKQPELSIFGQLNAMSDFSGDFATVNQGKSFCVFDPYPVFFCFKFINSGT